MKYQKEILITLIITILICFLKVINVFQMENELGTPIIMILMIICFSFTTIWIQKNIDKNYEKNHLFYQNLDILKYISAILIILLHVRPFLNVSNELDLAFNNIITRICVPIFFLITGYFVSKKEKTNPNYIKDYIRKTMTLYLTWSILYIPVIIGTLLMYFPIIQEYLSVFPFSLFLLFLCAPIIIVIAFFYTGFYYHLWYFPALIFSLLFLKYWKKKHQIKTLLFLSFLFLLFGATETYYGVLPFQIKELLSYYYKFFFTTRNFLFFGLFYVTLGYFIGTKEKAYSKYCFVKFILSCFLLIFEAILLHDTNRLNSNILLSCIPLTYYLFVSTIYMTNHTKIKFPFGNLSKYYYLIHPMILFFVSFFNIENPWIHLFCILFITHIVSFFLVKREKQKKK